MIQMGKSMHSAMTQYYGPLHVSPLFCELPKFMRIPSQGYIIRTITRELESLEMAPKKVNSSTGIYPGNYVNKAMASGPIF